LGEEYRSLSSWIWTFLHSPVAPSLSGPNISLNTPLSNLPFTPCQSMLTALS
jgi:hypothetical protein